jgi:hypothetical protein
MFLLLPSQVPDEVDFERVITEAMSSEFPTHEMAQLLASRGLDLDDKQAVDGYRARLEKVAKYCKEKPKKHNVSAAVPSSAITVDTQMRAALDADPQLLGFLVDHRHLDQYRRKVAADDADEGDGEGREDDDVSVHAPSRGDIFIGDSYKEGNYWREVAHLHGKEDQHGRKTPVILFTSFGSASTAPEDSELR